MFTVFLVLRPLFESFGAAQGFDPCTIYSALNPIFQSLAVAGALIAVGYFGAVKILSFVNPQLESRARQVPTNILMGFVAFAIGPWLIATMVEVFGLTGTVCA